jgi:hypothetical protein
VDVIGKGSAGYSAESGLVGIGTKLRSHSPRDYQTHSMYPHNPRVQSVSKHQQNYLPSLGARMCQCTVFNGF